MKKIFLALFLILLGTNPSWATSNLVNIPSSLAVKGQVRTMDYDTTSGVLYFGGAFSKVGPYQGSAIPMESGTGNALSAFPKVVGSVYAVVSDGAGGWYIGGSFHQVDGVSRSNLAHIIISSGSYILDSTWNPDVNNAVLAIAVSGTTVYVGGDFTSIGAVARNYIAAFDLSGTTPNVPTSWNPTANGSVRALVVDSGTLYVGGSFITIGGLDRGRVAAFNLTGPTPNIPTDWNPNVGGSVYSLAVSGSNVYVGGNFVLIGSVARNYLALFNLSSLTPNTPTSWDPNPNGIVRSIVATLSTIYVGGDFTAFGATSRNYLAEFNAVAGTLTSWNPNPNNIVRAISVNGPTVYVGGDFYQIGGVTRNYLAAFLPGGGSPNTPTSWDPDPTGAVYSLTNNGTFVYAGGIFTMVGGTLRNSLAAYNTTTHTLTPWNPNSNAGVNSLVVKGATVYVGGFFTSIGSDARNRIAAIDTSSGVATAWDPNANGSVSAISVNGSNVYVGGGFTSIGGATRNYLANIDATTAAATTWNPNASAAVYALALNTSHLYVGGGFTSLGATPRNYIASYDVSGALSNDPTDWNPNANFSVRKIVATDSTVYTAGEFTQMGVLSTYHVAEINATSSVINNWIPSVSGTVSSLAVSGPTVYVGGDFTSVGTGLALQSRNSLVSFDIISGMATSTPTTWNPNQNAPVLTLTTNGSTVYVGGESRVHTFISSEAEASGTGASSGSGGSATGGSSGTGGVSGVSGSGGDAGGSGSGASGGSLGTGGVGGAGGSAGDSVPPDVGPHADASSGGCSCHVTPEMY